MGENLCAIGNRPRTCLVLIRTATTKAGTADDRARTCQISLRASVRKTMHGRGSFPVLQDLYTSIDDGGALFENHYGIHVHLVYFCEIASKL